MKRITLRPLRTRRFGTIVAPALRDAHAAVEKSPVARLTVRRQLAVAGLSWFFATAAGGGR